MNPIVLGILLFLAAGIAGAFQENPESEPARVWLDARAREIIGMPVQNAMGERLGEVDDFVVRPGGEVRYVVLSFDDPGFGGELFSFELGQFRPVVGAGELQLNVEREALETRQGFEAVPPGFVEASELIGRDVVRSGGERLGEVEDLIVNFGTGRVRYIVVRDGPASATAYLPRELTFSSDRDQLVLAAPR